MPTGHKIVLNMVCCLGCRQVLISRTVHDYRTCFCGNKTVVDGGTEYLRRGGDDMALVEELSVVLHDGVLRKFADVRDVETVIGS